MLLRILIAADKPGLYKKLLSLFSKSDTIVEAIGNPKTLCEEVSQKTCDLLIVSRQFILSYTLEKLRSLQNLPDNPSIIVITEDENPEERAGFLAAGCIAVLNSKLSTKRLGDAFNTILDNRRKALYSALSIQKTLAEPTISDFASKSSAMKGLIKIVRQVINSNSSLLILGETGVGKERLARVIHTESKRAAFPFIAVNCGAMPESLLESELFGHEEGSFTGAVRSRRGCFELAHKGTIFLDEIAEIPIHLQVKLLRVLENREIRRVGSEKAIPLDVRIMAATNRDLEAAVKAKQFRMDLYYRLNVVPLTIPPLRDRREDIPELVENYISFLRTRIGRNVSKITDIALNILCQYAWPGNVRELINIIERAMLLCEGDTITENDLPGSINGTSVISAVPLFLQNNVNNINDVTEDLLRLPLKDVRRKVLEQVERGYLVGLLKATNGRIGETAKKAGIDKRTLFGKMKYYNLRKNDYLAKSVI